MLQVVLNKAISKTQKVRFFTPAVLANIASLYKWNGIVDATTNDNGVSYSSLSLMSCLSLMSVETKALSPITALVPVGLNYTCFL